LSVKLSDVGRRCPTSFPREGYPTSDVGSDYETSSFFGPSNQVKRDGWRAKNRALEAGAPVTEVVLVFSTEGWAEQSLSTWCAWREGDELTIVRGSYEPVLGVCAPRINFIPCDLSVMKACETVPWLPALMLGADEGETSGTSYVIDVSA
jgi:hypothetical protein